MYLATVKVGELLKGAAAAVVRSAEQRESYEDFVGVEAGIASVEEGNLRALDRLNHRLWYELDFVGYSGKVLCGVEQEGCAGSEEFAGTRLDDGSVGEFNSCGGAVPLLLALASGNGGAAVVCSELRLLHDEGDFVDLMFVVGAEGVAVEGFVVATDDFVSCGVGAYLLITHTETYHIDTHVSGRLVGVFAVDTFKDGVEHGEYFDVAVVVDCHFAVCLEVEGVNHVDIVEVSGGSFVGYIDGVLEGEIPHGEGFKLCITCLDAALVLVVELTEAHGHLAATRTRRGNDDQGACGVDIVVATETFIGVNEFYIVGVTVNGVVVVDLDALSLKAVAVSVCT